MEENSLMLKRQTGVEAHLAAATEWAWTHHLYVGLLVVVMESMKKYMTIFVYCLWDNNNLNLRFKIN